MSDMAETLNGDAPVRRIAFERRAEVESLALAKRFVYCDGKVTGSPVRDSAPVPPDGYTDEAKAVAERRIVLAGHRLAHVLRIAAASPASSHSAK